MPKLKCTGCKQRFEKESMLKFGGSNYHSIDCATTYAYNKQVKKNERKAAKAKKEQKAKDKRWKAENKPKQKRLSEAQAVINRYVRIRDRNKGCISCDRMKHWPGQWHASHYYSRGHSSSLRFNLWNIHKSCSVCNAHLSGNIGEYTPRLIEKIGQERYDYLKSRKSDITTYDNEYLERMKRVFSKKCRRLELT